jgi:hypothetical protein
LQPRRNFTKSFCIKQLNLILGLVVIGARMSRPTAEHPLAF